MARWGEPFRFYPKNDFLEAGDVARLPKFESIALGIAAPEEFAFRMFLQWLQLHSSRFQLVAQGCSIVDAKVHPVFPPPFAQRFLGLKD